MNKDYGAALPNIKSERNDAIAPIVVTPKLGYVAFWFENRNNGLLLILTEMERN